jgi:L-asparaginase II
VRARHDLTNVEIAIACASHGATSQQLAAVRSLLAKAHATEDDLELGPQVGRAPQKIYNNCSGKHAGMLALCDVNGWPRRGYHEAGHPVQRACAHAHAEAAEVDEESFATGSDGCGVVAFALPLHRMAHAFSRLPGLSQATPIVAAMRAHPELVGGTDGADVQLMQGTATWVAKGGAEGLLCAVDTQTMTGIALKAEDGAFRALGPALAAFAGVALPRTDIRNTRGEIVGEVSLRTSSA